jgi:hypothetical protein
MFARAPLFIARFLKQDHERNHIASSYIYELEDATVTVEQSVVDENKCEMWQVGEIMGKVWV